MTRFPRYAVSELCELLKDDLSRNTARSRALPIDTQMLAALQFYASGSFQWIVGRSCGLLQSAVSHCVSNVTDALLKRSPEYISFPTDTPTLRSTKQSFYTVAHFPNVIGAIDCTHIPACSGREPLQISRSGLYCLFVSHHIISAKELQKCSRTKPVSGHFSDSRELAGSQEGPQK